jgi:hypothetical protein
LPLELVSVIRDRASCNQLLALVGALIDQFSILTKATICAGMASRQYNFTQAYQLYLFLFELKNQIIGCVNDY